jgi:hypothetical protein
MERLDDAFPNAFYDVLVFMSPSILLVLGASFGVFGVGVIHLYVRPTASDLVLALVGLLFLGYEYGRLAETLSHSFVTAPLGWLVKRRLLLRSPDYSRNLDAETASLELPGTSKSSPSGNKWALYFFASAVAPALGRDLMKRYAWEKLSRSSAFTALLLFAASLVAGFFRWNGVAADKVLLFSFGTTAYSLTFGGLWLATSYEYYRRHCWNTDLLRKVLPVLLYVSRRGSANPDAAGGYRDR